MTDPVPGKATYEKQVRLSMRTASQEALRNAVIVEAALAHGRAGQEAPELDEYGESIDDLRDALSELQKKRTTEPKTTASEENSDFDITLQALLDLLNGLPVGKPARPAGGGEPAAGEAAVKPTTGRVTELDLNVIEAWESDPMDSNDVMSESAASLSLGEDVVLIARIRPFPFVAYRADGPDVAAFKRAARRSSTIEAVFADDPWREPRLYGGLALDVTLGEGAGATRWRLRSAGRPWAKDPPDAEMPQELDDIPAAAMTVVRL